MKKLLFLPFILAAFLASACSDDDVKPGPPQVDPPALEVEEDQYNFTSAGGQGVIEVKIQNAYAWSASTTDSWITVGEPDFITNTVTFSVDKLDSFEPRTGGIITISTKDAPDIQVKVSQNGVSGDLEIPAIIYDRPSVSRMNLMGGRNIESISFYPDLVGGMDMYDVRFNVHGNVTSFYTILPDNVVGEEIPFDVTVTYDAQNRISVVKGVSDFHNGFDLLQFQFTFNYGNHGKYIWLPDFFNGYLEQQLLAWGRFELWMPRMIKDVESIDIYNTYVIEQPNWTLNIIVDGDTATASQDYQETIPGETVIYRYEFEGDFTSSFSYPSFMGFESVKTFQVNPTNGYLISYNDYFEAFGEIVETAEFNDDRINSQSSYEDLLYGKDNEYTYNENLDLSRLVDDVSGTDYSFTYEYDERGNWTKITLFQTDPDTGEPLTEIGSRERSVSYR